MVANRIVLEGIPEPLRWTTLKASGWQVLLPPPRYDTVLCYDNLDGATMLLAAGLARQVLLLHHDRESLEALVGIAAQAGIADRVRFRDGPADVQGLYGWPAAADESRVDGVLIHDPAARCLRNPMRGPRDLDTLCLRLARIVRADGGFIYLGLRNRYGYQWLRQPGAGRRLLPVTAAHRSLNKAGAVVQRYPFLIDGTRLFQIVTTEEYQSAQNSFLPSERLRRLLLRGWGLRNLAPAYGLVGSLGTPRPTWLACVLADPWVRSLVPQPVIRRCLALNGKLVLSVGERGTSEGRVVLVVTPDQVAAGRRRVEAEWLRRLAHGPGCFSEVIPRFLGERDIGGSTVFALSERPGITVEAGGALVSRLTRTTASWLREFHRSTARLTQLTDRDLDRVAGPTFEEARQRYPPLLLELTALERAMRARLLGQTIPLVFMHGDFKLENAVFLPPRYELTGVIDWELAQDPGLPLADLLYLLVYNRLAGHSFGLLEPVVSTALRWEWTPGELARIEEYCAALALSRPTARVLAAFFAIHHVGVRLRLADHGDSIESIRALLAAAAAAMASPA